MTSLFQILGFRCWDGNSECENVNLTIYFLSRSHCVHVGASGACAGGGGGLSSRKPRLLLSSWAEPAPGARQLLAARGISSAVRLAELCSPREAGHKPTHLHTQCAVCRLDTFPHLVSCRWLWTRLNKTIDTLIYRHYRIFSTYPSIHCGAVLHKIDGNRNSVLWFSQLSSRENYTTEFLSPNILWRKKLSGHYLVSFRYIYLSSYAYAESRLYNIYTIILQTESQARPH